LILTTLVKHKLSKTDTINPIELPCKKTLYNSQADALEAIKYMTEIRVVELKAYKCSVCGFWHLTSK
jgi:lipopolysaccharide biosynthesis regulator YciM